MVRKTSHSFGKTYVYYVCCRRCKGGRISEYLLTECVKSAFQSHIDNIINIDKVLRFIDELPHKQDAVQKLDRQIASRRAEIDRYEKLLFSLYDSLKSGIINDDEYRQMKIRYNTLRSEREKAINSLNHEIDEIINSGAEKQHWIERFKKHQYFMELSRRMVVYLLDVVTVYPGNRLDILLRYNYDYERCVSFVKDMTPEQNAKDEAAV